MPKPDLTDEQIGKAIQKTASTTSGVRQFDPHTHLLNDITTESNSYAEGTDPLAVYALLQCSAAISDPTNRYPQAG